MLKNILNLKGAQQLNKNEQNTIHGGGSSRCDTATAALCNGLPDGACCGFTLPGQPSKTCKSGCCYGPTIKTCP